VQSEPAFIQSPSHSQNAGIFQDAAKSQAGRFALQIAYFNFCRPHSALKIKATETTPAKEQTPAMAQGITNHIWTVEQLLGGF
jgi:hypothetical protein